MSAGILHNRCSAFEKGKPPGKIAKQYFFAATPGLSCDGRGTMFLHQGIEFSQAAAGSGRVQVKGQRTRRNARCACFREMRPNTFSLVGASVLWLTAMM